MSLRQEILIYQRVPQEVPGSNLAGGIHFGPCCGEGSDILFWTLHALKVTLCKP